MAVAFDNKSLCCWQVEGRFCQIECAPLARKNVEVLVDLSKGCAQELGAARIGNIGKGL